MDIKRVIEERFGSVRVSQGQNGLEYLVVCPQCGKRKLSINPDKGVWQCWHGCGSGSLRKLLKVPYRKPAEQPKPEVKKAAGFTSAGALTPLHSLGPEHQAITYIRSRGFDPKYLEDVFGVCYCGQGRQFARGTFSTTNTLILPVWQHEALVGWQSRLLYNPDKVPEDSWPYLGWKYDNEEGKYIKPPKYMTMPGYSKRTSLYNIDWASRGEVVVVTEGAFDCMAVGKCGVATFGKGISPEQVELIKNIWKVAILLLDPDAMKDQAGLASMLSKSILTVPVALSGYKDAGDCPRDELWRQIRRSAEENEVFRRERLTLDAFRFQI